MLSNIAGPSPHLCFLQALSCAMSRLICALMVRTLLDAILLEELGFVERIKQPAC